MTKKNEIGLRLREKLLSEILLSASKYEGFAERLELLAQMINSAFDSVSLTEQEQSRLITVLQSYKTLKDKSGRPINSKAISLAQRIAPYLPGERFWFVSPIENKGIRFESEVATVEIRVKDESDE